MKTPVIHAVIDPLCGWTYAVLPLLKLAKETLNISVTIYGGGLLVGKSTRQITEEWREFVKPHDEHISQVSGQLFGQAYTDGLLKNHDIVLDSEPPITALMAIEAMGGNALAMLTELQNSHYQHGLCACDMTVISDSVKKLGYDIDHFLQLFEKLQGIETKTHIEKARAFMREMGGSGFPTLALSMDDKQLPASMKLLNHSYYYGHIDNWLIYLKDHLQTNIQPVLSS